MGSPGNHARRSARIDTTGATLLDNMVTQTGAPCYSISALVAADMQEGQPLVVPEALEDWRVARVQTYAVPPARMGYGEGGTRPFHQDYRWGHKVSHWAGSEHTSINVLLHQSVVPC